MVRHIELQKHSPCPLLSVHKSVPAKMHGAAVLLRTTDRTVLDIAGQFGYDNGSKFARAFRDVIGVSPAAYRAGADGDSCAPESVTPQSC